MMGEHVAHVTAVVTRRDREVHIRMLIEPKRGAMQALVTELGAVAETAREAVRSLDSAGGVYRAIPGALAGERARREAAVRIATEARVSQRGGTVELLIRATDRDTEALLFGEP